MMVLITDLNFLKLIRFKIGICIRIKRNVQQYFYHDKGYRNNDHVNYNFI